MSNLSLHELGFGQGLIQHLSQYDPSSLLGFRCQPPYHWKSSSISNRPVVPLWECGTTLAYFHRDTQFFETCSLADIDNVWVRYKSIQAILADLLIDLYEDELTEDELRSAAKILGFQNIERFICEIHARVKVVH